MAIKKPLVLGVNGKPAQLQSGDTISATDAPGAGSADSRTTIMGTDFAHANAVQDDFIMAAVAAGTFATVAVIDMEAQRRLKGCSLGWNGLSIRIFSIALTLVPSHAKAQLTSVGYAITPSRLKTSFTSARSLTEVGLI